MEKIIEQLYKIYQKKSDADILKTFVECQKKSESKRLDEIESMELKNRLKALHKIIEERNLELRKSTPPKVASPPKENPHNAFKDGGKALLIGGIIILISIGLVNAFEGYKIFFLGIIIGCLKFIEGTVVLAIGVFYRYTDGK